MSKAEQLLESGHYSAVLSGNLLEFFRSSILTDAAVLTIRNKEVKIIRGLPESVSAPFVEARLLIETNEAESFLVFESIKNALDFVVENFKVNLGKADLDFHLEVKNLKRQLGSYVEPGTVITTDPQMLRIIDIARHVADTDVPVLILGESGVGKEVIAKFIHEQSGRQEKPFIKISCAALPQELLESELFGYERGAFTGAIRDHAGKFEQADNGTLLLDEIGDMSPHLQAKLLHVLQDGEFSHLGGKKTVRVNVRVLAATNKKLSEAVLRGEFRNDLYFRLNVIKLEIPPLRNRREDIPLLSNFLLGKYRERYNGHVTHFPPELVEAFLRHDWPGNVRQLENVVKRFLILGEIDIVDLLGSTPQNFVGPVPISYYSLKEISAKAAEVAEKEVVLRMLEETDWNRKETARRLKFSYKALRNKLKKWNLTNNQTKPSGN